jgi:hypothetical protein
LDQEASNIHQVRIRFLNSSFLVTLLNHPAFFVVDIENASSRGEQTPQENPSLDTPKNLVGMVDTLVNLQDLHEPVVTMSAINLSQEKVYHIPD